MAKSWSSRSLGTRLGHNIFYRTISLFGSGAAYIILYPVILYYFIKQICSKSLYPYILRRFIGSGFFSRWWHQFRINLAFGQVLVDRAVMGITGQMDFTDTGNSWANISDVLEKKTGLVVLTAHVGAWQTGMAWLAECGLPINIALAANPEDIDLHYFEHNTSILPPKIINLSEPVAAMAAMTSALLAGEILAFMGDRVTGAESLTVKAPFLGGHITLPGTPFYLATRLEVPLAVAFTSRLGKGQVVGQIYKVLCPENYNAKKAVENSCLLANQYTEALTDYVREWPYQFFNYHDLWR